MSAPVFTALFAALCPWLVLIRLLQLLVARLGLGVRGWARTLLFGAVALGLLFIPIGGLPLVRWIAGFNANFSLVFAGLVGIAVAENGCGRRWFAPRDWRTAWAFGLGAGLVLYPFALGLGRHDPYAWGWRFSPLFVFAGLLAAFLLLKQNRFGFLLLFAVAGYQLSLLESRNYWDYLLDPVYCVAAIPALGLSWFPRKMNIEVQRKVDALLGPVICRVLSWLRAVWPQRPPARPPRRILIILLSEMGSLVLTRPMLERLQRSYPGAAIHALVFAKNREVLDLLGLVPSENVLVLDDSSLLKFGGGVLRLLAQFRRLKFDVVIDCELFARVSSILSFFTGAPLLVGFTPHTQEGLYRGSFINRPVMYNPYKHIAQQFLALAAAIESETHPKAKESCFELPEPPPWLEFPPQELEQVRRKLHQDFPAVADRKLVLVYPSGGALPIRAWPAESYLELCHALLAEGYAVGIIGTLSYHAPGREIVARCANPLCIDLTGYTPTIRYLMALFHRASLLITNDGGPGQFAALTPVPTIVFFGPETPALYGPLSRNTYCFHTPLSCSPCLTAYNHRTSPCDGDNQCLKRITTAQVLAKAREMLAANSAVPTK